MGPADDGDIDCSDLCYELIESTLPPGILKDSAVKRDRAKWGRSSDLSMLLKGFGIGSVIV